MKSRFFLSAFCIVHFALYVRAETVPVMLYAGKSAQSDTLGFNIVTDLSTAVYRSVLNGSVKLWDSQKKDIQVLPSSLQKIEKSYSVTFSGCEHLFIYEVWTLEKKLSSSDIIGFYFSSQDKSGQTISFGYVDAKELPDTILGNYVHLNENGSEPVTIQRVLRCKLYFFSVVQYRGKKITSTEEAQALKKEKSAQVLKFIPCPELKEMKTVIYSITRDDSLFSAEENAKGNALLETLEDFFIENREILLNIGGASALNDKVNKSFRVTAMKVNELWKKENGEINMEPQIITLFINDRPVHALSIKEFLSFGIIYDFKSIYDVLKEKDFSMRILQINGNDIPFKYSNSYLRALRKYKWNGLTEYVKYD